MTQVVQLTWHDTGGAANIAGHRSKQTRDRSKQTRDRSKQTRERIKQIRDQEIFNKNLVVSVAMYTKYEVIRRSNLGVLIYNYFDNTYTPVNQSLPVKMFYPTSTTATTATSTADDVKYKSIFPKINSLKRDVTLVIGVPSSRDHFEFRKMVRKSWGSISKNPNAYVILLFFIGLDTMQHSPIQQKVDYEAKEFGDIVQDDYIDSYRNLSLKTLSILKWVSEYCPKSQFILKADDDMYINVPLLIDHLKNHAHSSGPNPTFILGQVSPNDNPIRDNSSKGFVSVKEYNETRYPTYVFGPSYSMTTSAARLIYEASKTVPYFSLEDVYVTGMCARKAGIPLIHSHLFYNIRLSVSGCTFRNRISAHEFQHDEMAKIDAEMRDPNIKCR
ncbi:Lactosylceramide 1,3-N-acetyl-beta-D-glucosaminyltransferase [Bulinus truncatus]|nr:Lactosylceramide 1,3-N-acetyl-beta-D-glucosaminyltransferase [Bulinus truncatus]